jgi:hypothetical protein
MGVIVFRSEILAGLFFPPTSLIIAALPPLAAVAWFACGEMGRLTWRRSLIVLASSATISLVIGGLLQLLLAFMSSIFFTNLSLARPISWLESLSGDYNTLFTAGDATLFILIQLAIIYPIVTELAKSLSILPFINSLSRRDVFLLGAIAGAGLAAVESAVMAGFAFQSWVLVLFIQFWGGAIHPLCSGLTAMAWYDAARGRTSAWAGGMTYFGIAIVFRSLWNTGILAILTVTSLASFVLTNQGSVESISWFGEAILIGLLATLLLVGLGPFALWTGRSLAQRLQQPDDSTLRSHLSKTNVFQRAAAVWAFVSLVVILPIGIIGMRYLF